MRNQPDGAGLLEIARETLRGDLIDALPADKRYEALMIANAMAIAARQIAAGDTPFTSEKARLQELLDAEGDLTELNRELARRLRVGDFAPGTPNRDRIYDILWQATEQKVRESNPKYLASLDEI